MPIPWNKFVIAAYDKKGFGTQVGLGTNMREKLNLPRELLFRAQALVNDRKTPYRTVHDLLRDALYHRMCELEEEILPGVDVGPWAQLAEYDDEKLRIDGMKQFRDGLRDDLRELVKDSDWPGLAAQLKRADRLIAGFREPYRAASQAIADQYRQDYSRELQGITP